MTEDEIAKRFAQSLDHSSGDAIINQIVDTIWQDVIEGVLETGERMPTVRTLSVEVGCSPRVVSRSYERLEQLGVLTNRAGEGTYVSLKAADPALRERWKELESICRTVASQAQSLGFTLDEVIDTLSDLRSNNT